MSGKDRTLPLARRVVVKVGSSLLVDETAGSADRAWLTAFTADKIRGSCFKALASFRRLAANFAESAMSARDNAASSGFSTRPCP